MVSSSNGNIFPLTEATGATISLTGDMPHSEVLAKIDDIPEKRNVRYGIEFCGAKFLTPAKTTSEIVSNFTVFHLPNTANWIKGLINLRGNLIPVFDLYLHPDYQANLADAEQADEARKLIVIGQATYAAGLLIERYPETLDLDDDAVNISDTLYFDDDTVNISATVEQSALQKMLGKLGVHILKTVTVGTDVYYEIDYDAFFSGLTRAYADDTEGTE